MTTKTFCWNEPLENYSLEKFKNWKNVARHIKDVIILDLATDEGWDLIDIDAEAGHIYVCVRRVDERHWKYFEEVRNVEGEEDLVWDEY